MSNIERVIFNQSGPIPIDIENSSGVLTDGRLFVFVRVTVIQPSGEIILSNLKSKILDKKLKGIERLVEKQ